jgi:energy-coupling factor transporter transmembrane protein EcfT
MNPIISIPTFAAVIFLIHLKTPEKSNWKHNLQKLDLSSFAIFLASIVCLLIVLQWGGTKYPWKNARIIVPFIVFGVLLGVFVLMQVRKKDEGLVPLRIITRRSIIFGMMYSFCTSGAGFILEYYVSSTYFPL